MVLSLRVFAASFENLDFEQASTNSVHLRNPGRTPSGFDLLGSVTDLLPGWQVLQGTNPVTEIGFNLADVVFSEEGGVTVNDTNSIFALASVLEGKFSLELNMKNGPDSKLEPFSISQRGDIPADAGFLSYVYRGNVVPSINGIDLVPEGLFPEFSPKTEYIDISQFAGENVKLGFRNARFMTTGGPVLSGSRFVIDDIAFVVPEPGTFTLLSMGAAILGGAALLRRKATSRHRQAGNRPK